MGTGEDKEGSSLPSSLEGVLKEAEEWSGFQRGAWRGKPGKSQRARHVACAKPVGAREC